LVFSFFWTPRRVSRNLFPTYQRVQLGVGEAFFRVWFSLCLSAARSFDISLPSKGAGLWFSLSPVWFCVFYPDDRPFFFYLAFGRLPVRGGEGAYIPFIKRHLVIYGAFGRFVTGTYRSHFWTGLFRCPVGLATSVVLPDILWDWVSSNSLTNVAGFFLATGFLQHRP